MIKVQIQMEIEAPPEKVFDLLTEIPYDMIDGSNDFLKGS